MRHRERAQLRLAEAHLRTLAHLAKRHGMTMTDLLNLIVATALEDLEQAPAICDDAQTLHSMVHGRTRERHPVQGRRHGPAGHTPSRAHDRHRLRRVVTIRQHHQRDARHH